jgi:hypothetical protein
VSATATPGLWASYGDPTRVFAPRSILHGHRQTKGHTVLLIVILNVALCLFVIIGVVGLQLWGIVTSHPREALPSLPVHRAAPRQRLARRPAGRELASLRPSR